MTDSSIPIADTPFVAALAEALPASAFVADERLRIRSHAGDDLPELADGAVPRRVDEFGLPGLADDCRRALAGETVTSTVAVDGETFELACAPLDADGRTRGVLGTVRRRTADGSWGAGTAVAPPGGALLNETPVMGISVEYRDGVPHIRDCNEAIVDALGYDAADLVGRPLADIYTADSAERMIDDDAEWIEGGFRIEGRRLVAADGRTIRTLLHAVPERRPDGSFAGVRALYLNLSSHDRIRRELRESRDKIEKLHDTAARLMACRREEAVYELAVEAAEEILAFDICGIDAVEGEYFVPKAVSTGMTADGYDRLPVGDGIAGKTYRTGESYLVDDVREVTDAKPAREAYRSIISVPVGDVGVFQAGSRRVGAFDESDVEPAELLTSHVAAAVDRIRSDRARRESEEKYRSLVEGSLEAIYIYRDTEFLFVNDRVAEISGYSKEELYDMPIPELVHPDDRNWVFRLAQRRREGKGVPDTYQARILTADGGVKHCEFSVTEISYGGRTASLGSARDVTAQKEREEALTALQEATRGMMAAKTPADIASLLAGTATEVLGYPVGAVWFADDEGRLRPVSTSERTPDTPLSVLSDGPSVPWRVYEAGEARTFEHVQERDDLPDVPVASIAAAPLGDHGVFLAASTTDPEFPESGFDLLKLLAANAEAALDRAARETLLRERERELERQNEKLEFLNSLLRHNILNGMTVMLGRVELLKLDADDAQRDHLDTVSTWGTDIVELIRKIRRVMDSAIGREVAAPEPVPLHAALAPEVEKLRDSYDAAVVTADLGDDLAVLADEMLGEIFENLLSNAVVHNDAATPRVHVEVATDDETALVRIRDNGPGITRERQDEIFGRGEKGPKSTGTGYGLYLSATIVDGYGGDLSVESDGTDGSEFVVELPLAGGTTPE